MAPLTSVPVTTTGAVRVVPVMVRVTCPVGAAPVPEVGATVIAAGAPSTVAFVTLTVVVEAARDTPTPTTFTSGEFAAPDWTASSPERVFWSPGPGLNVIVAVHDAPTASGALQLVVVSLKSGVLPNAVKLNGAFPSFTTVTLAVAVEVAVLSVPKLIDASAITKFTSSGTASVMYTSSVESIATDVGLVTVGAMIVWFAGVSVPLTSGTRTVPPGIAIYTAPDGSTARPVALLRVVSSVV